MGNIVLRSLAQCTAILPISASAAAATVQKKPLSVEETRSSLTAIMTMLQTLDTKERYLEEQVEKETEQALALSKAKKKKAALVCLKRKMMCERQIDRLNHSRDTLNQQKMIIENAHMDAETLRTIEIGAKTMSKITKSVDVGDLEDMLHDMQDDMKDMTDISETISRPIDILQIDEDELEEQWEAMEQAELDKQLAQLEKQQEEQVAKMHFPPAPFTNPKSNTSGGGGAAAETVKEDGDEDELQRLAEDMRM